MITQLTMTRELVKKAQKGSSEAYIQLFAQYEADLYRIAYVYVRNEQDALDIVQETAYKSFKSIKTLKQERYFKTWLIRIAISCSLDLLRQRKKWEGLAVPQEERVIAVGGMSGADEEAIIESLSLWELIDSLDADEKGVILLRFYKDYTIREVSEVLEMPLGTAKTILYRALNKLRLHLKEDEDDEQPH